MSLNKHVCYVMLYSIQSVKVLNLLQISPATPKNDNVNGPSERDFLKIANKNKFLQDTKNLQSAKK